MSLCNSSKELFAGINALRSDAAIAPFITDVRGRGLMVGVEFASPAPASDPFVSPDAPKDIASRVAKKCLDQGLFILTTSVYQVRARFSFVCVCDVWTRGDLRGM